MTGRLRIAVADDEPDMQQCFQKMFSHIGHEVVSVAGTGQELVEHCETHHPDLVITDIKMPDMDGIEAAEQLYKNAPCRLSWSPHTMIQNSLHGPKATTSWLIS